ncbi:MAG: hypothetical protein K2X72_31475 [Reyranella sp.]|nr:hypothetical protein [Reyranella sp.]
MLLLAASAGCAPPAQQWQSVSGQGTPTVAEASDCRTQARRQAGQRYPYDRRGVPGPAAPGISTAELDRSAAETAFYNECLRQKGYRLVDTR